MYIIAISSWRFVKYFCWVTVRFILRKYIFSKHSSMSNFFKWHTHGSELTLVFFYGLGSPIPCPVYKRKRFYINVLVF